MAFDAAAHEVRLSAAANLQPGSYSARWGNWVVGLRSRDAGWGAKVWRWPPNTAISERVEIASHDGFKLTIKAVEWACDTMRRDGAIVMVLDAPHITLERMLSFAPAPEAVD